MQPQSRSQARLFPEDKPWMPARCFSIQFVSELSA